MDLGAEEAPLRELRGLSSGSSLVHQEAELLALGHQPLGDLSQLLLQHGCGPLVALLPLTHLPAQSLCLPLRQLACLLQPSQPHGKLLAAQLINSPQFKQVGNGAVMCCCNHTASPQNVDSNINLDS